MMTLPFASHFPADVPAFWSCFFVLFIFGFLNGVLQSQVFALAGMMPFKYIAAVMFGNGLSGIAMNILRAILQLALPSEDDSFYMALIFAIGASSVLVAAGVIFTPLFSNPYFLYYLNKSKG